MRCWARSASSSASQNRCPAAVVGTSTGLFGAVWAQAEARKVLAALGADVLDRELPVGQAHSAFDGDRLADRELESALAAIVTDLVAIEDALPLAA